MTTSDMIVIICVIGFVTTIVMLIQVVKRQSNFIMSFKSVNDFQLSEPAKIRKLAEEDIKRKKDDNDWEAYKKIMAQGNISEKDEKRFGITDGTIG